MCAKNWVWITGCLGQVNPARGHCSVIQVIQRAGEHSTAIKKRQQEKAEEWSCSQTERARGACTKQEKTCRVFCDKGRKNHQDREAGCKAEHVQKRAQQDVYRGLPAAVYGAEHEPWKEKEIAGTEKHAVKALQLRPPGVPFAVAALTLPADADPRFKIHFAATERWSREVWANAYTDGRGFQGKRRVGHPEAQGAHGSRVED